MFFLLFSCIFPLILMQTFIFRNFLKMLIFRIFLLRFTLEWFWTFGARIFIFILSKLQQGCKKKKNTRIWRKNQYSYTKSWENRLGNYIWVNRRISPEGRYWRKAEGECFAPFLNFYLKLMFFYCFLLFSPLILMQTLIFKNFWKMTFFRIFSLYIESVSELSLNEFSILLYQNFRRDHKKMFSVGFYIWAIIFIPGYATRRMRKKKITNE